MIIEFREKPTPKIRAPKTIFFVTNVWSLLGCKIKEAVTDNNSGPEIMVKVHVAINKK
jgi:hypothetical protein